MNLNLRYNLWKAKRRLSPDSVFRFTLWKKLENAWQEKYHFPIAWYSTVAFKRAVVFAVIVLVAAGVGTGAYAYNSPEVTEGSALYPIKKQIENIEEKLQKTPEDKAKFYLKVLRKRQEEAEVLKKKGKQLERVNLQILKTKEQLHKTERMLERVESKDINLRKEIREKFRDQLETRRDRLENKIEKVKEKKVNFRISNLS